jgi:hypothetical protein
MRPLLLLAVIIVALLAGLVASGEVHVSFVKGEFEPQTAVHDVQLIAEAAHRHGADETALAVSQLVGVAAERGGTPGSQLLQKRLPPLAAQLVGQLPATMAEVRAVEVETQAGEACRQAALRLLARDEWLYREVGAEAVRSKPTEQAIRGFVTGYEANARGYEADVEECLALARPDERRAVADLMNSF